MEIFQETRTLSEGLLQRCREDNGMLPIKLEKLLADNLVRRVFWQISGRDFNLLSPEDSAY